MAPLNDLSDLSIDEVSVVKRGAIGRVWAFLKSDDNGDLELSKSTVDAMGTPLDGEEALVAEFEKDGLDEATAEAGLIAHRLKSLFDKAKKPAPTDAEMNADENGGDNDAEPDADDLKKAGTSPYTDTNGPDKKKRAKRVSGDPDTTPELNAVAKDDDPEPPLAKSGDETVAGSTNEAKERGMGDSPSVPVQKADGTWDLSGVDADARPFYDAFLKSHDDAVAKADALAERVEKAEADNAELKTTLVVKELTAQAEGEFSKIAKAEELTPVLKAMKDKLAPEEFEKATEILKAANARIEAGDLFAELGRSSDAIIAAAVKKGENLRAPGGGDAWDQIVENANAMVLKDGEDLNEEQRVTKYLTTPEGQTLYADYRAENPAAVR